MLTPDQIKKKFSSPFICLSFLSLFVLITSGLFAKNEHDGRFITAYQLYMKRLINRPTSAGNREIEESWSTFESISEEFLQAKWNQRINMSYQMGLFRRALSQYDFARKLFLKYQESLKENEKKRLRIKDPLWWKEIDYVESVNREEFQLQNKYNHRLALSFRKVIETLDLISDSNFRAGRSFRALEKVSYRGFVIHQMAIGLYASAFNILKKYERYPRVKLEWPFHYNISLCYNSFYREAKKNRGISDKNRRMLRAKRNHHFLASVELKFGKQSKEYNRILKKILFEELGSP